MDYIRRAVYSNLNSSINSPIITKKPIISILTDYGEKEVKQYSSTKNVKGNHYGFNLK